MCVCVCVCCVCVRACVCVYKCVYILHEHMHIFNICVHNYMIRLKNRYAKTQNTHILTYAHS